MIPWNTLHNVFFFCSLLFLPFYTRNRFRPILNPPRCNCYLQEWNLPSIKFAADNKGLWDQKKKPGGKYSILDLHYVEFLYLSSQEGVLVQMNLLLYFLQKVSFPVSLWQQEHQVINWPLLQHVNMKMKTPTFYMHLSFFYAWIQGHMMQRNEWKNDFLPFCGSWNKWEKMEVVGFAEVLSFDPDLSDSLLFLFFSEFDLPLWWCPLSRFEDWSLVSVISVVGLSEDLLLLAWLSVAGGLFEMLLVAFGVSSSEFSESVLPKMASKRSMEGRASSCKLFSANWK